MRLDDGKLQTLGIHPPLGLTCGGSVVGQARGCDFCLQRWLPLATSRRRPCLGRGAKLALSPAQLCSPIVIDDTSKLSPRGRPNPRPFGLVRERGAGVPLGGTLRAALSTMGGSNARIKYSAPLPVPAFCSSVALEALNRDAATGCLPARHAARLSQWALAPAPADPLPWP